MPQAQLRQIRIYRPRHATRRNATSYAGYKRGVDLVLAILLLIPALPVIAALWALVKLTSRGPGIYCQRRTGLNGRAFVIYKLRSMANNCERGTGAVWARKNDARVTPLGKFLRKSHLDELPQLFNVLKGDMSLVGPRPERPEIIEKVAPSIRNYDLRLAQRPGVTGLAQIFADADLTLEDVKRKLGYDLEYFNMMSLWFDLRIIFCTALKVVGLNRPFVRSILFPSVADISAGSSPRRFDRPADFFPPAALSAAR
jgi:lipopolysaccharide/colanic/teichoic acid biosynthesis glycosyltransferase